VSNSVKPLYILGQDRHMRTISSKIMATNNQWRKLDMEGRYRSQAGVYICNIHMRAESRSLLLVLAETVDCQVFPSMRFILATTKLASNVMEEKKLLVKCRNRSRNLKDHPEDTVLARTLEGRCSGDLLDTSQQHMARRFSLFLTHQSFNMFGLPFLPRPPSGVCCLTLAAATTRASIFFHDYP
jgi:hypothetical protein